MMEYRGVGAAPGIAIGPSFRFRKPELRFQHVQARGAEAERARLEAALHDARSQIGEVLEKVEREAGGEYAGIFEAHAAILEDPELLHTVHMLIDEDSQSAEAAFDSACEKYARLIEALEDEVLKARAADVRDVRDRVLRILLGEEAEAALTLDRESILLAVDLAPSDTAAMDKTKVLGFCTALGGVTSHVAILARALGIPAVVAAGMAVLEAPDGATVALDGGTGEIVVDPDPSAIAVYRARRDQWDARLAQALADAHQPAATPDGHRVEIFANIGTLEGARAAVEAGAEGIGLLRSEFLYLDRPEAPGEEEQFQAYRAILENVAERPVILRTLDIGGDKEWAFLDLPAETNPFLGLRGLRLSLRRPDLLKPQLRAALRAGAGRDLRIMFPMVTTLSELNRVRAMLEECQEELARAGHPAASDPEVGIMIEVPSAAIMADRLAASVDFFSLGTNDLTQYVMAADRTNPEVTELTSGLHPPVLRLIHQVVESAHQLGKSVGICGELASEPPALPILVGLSLDELSMNPAAIPLVKQMIRKISLKEAKAVARAALELDQAEEVEALVRSRFPQLFAD